MRSRARNDLMQTSPAQLARMFVAAVRNVRSQESQRRPNPQLHRTRSAPLRAPLSRQPLGGMRTLTLTALFLCVPGPGSSVITQPADSPHRNFRVIYYDASYLFGARNFGDARDFGGNTIPAFFVHSKARGCWMQISAVATRGGKFGKSHSSDPEEEKRLNEISDSWDFTPLAKKKFADLPLNTGSSIDFPDLIEDDETNHRYLLHFNSALKIPAAETVLYVKKADLEEALTANRRCPATIQ